ncbi:MAG: fasciclin domain-containing protein, partial [Ilumatobacter sp.]|nr:fasciclin domain-containing protein [Ilumatobacter sp.]
AFGKLDEATVSAVTSDNELLTTVLTHHVVVGKYNLDQLTDGMELETLAGDTLTVTVDDQGVVSIDGYPVAVGNVQATNGVIHVMGDVLVPEG